MPKAHKEPHRIKAIGWLRAAVLGANDRIISMASLIIGVASAHAEHGHLVLTGLAGLVVGAMSMATGEYVSVSSQADTETAALAEEQAELDAHGAREHRELAAIYVRRGLDMALAKQVAQALMASRCTRRARRRRIGYFGNDRGKSVAGRARVGLRLFGGSRFAAHRHGVRPAAMGGTEYRGDGAGSPGNPWRACRARRRSESGSGRIAGYLLERSVDRCGIRGRCYIRRHLSRDIFRNTVTRYFAGLSSQRRPVAAQVQGVLPFARCSDPSDSPGGHGSST